MRPTIDDTLLSPSGRCSKRAREALLALEKAKLFPPGYFDAPPKSSAEMAAEKAATLRRRATELRALAACGMKPRAYRKEAARLEAEAELLA